MRTDHELDLSRVPVSLCASLLAKPKLSIPKPAPFAREWTSVRHRDKHLLQGAPMADFSGMSLTMDSVQSRFSTIIVATQWRRSQPPAGEGRSRSVPLRCAYLRGFLPKRSLVVHRGHLRRGGLLRDVADHRLRGQYHRRNAGHSQPPRGSPWPMMPLVYSSLSASKP